MENQTRASVFGLPFVAHPIHNMHSFELCKQFRCHQNSHHFVHIDLNQFRNIRINVKLLLLALLPKMFALYICIV